MLKTSALSLVGAITIFFGSSFFGLSTPSRAQARFPDGPGLATLQSVCTQCHGLEPIVSTGHNADEWQGVIFSMIGQGADIADEEMPDLVAYLAKNFPRAGTVVAPTASPAATASPTSPKEEKPTVQGLQLAGELVVNAVRGNDAAALGGIVDQEITLGANGMPLSADLFKQQVSAKTGAYCALFGCAGSAKTVRGLLESGAPIKIVPHLSENGTGQAEVFSERAAGTPPVLTMSFVWRNGWRLTKLEYV